MIKRGKDFGTGIRRMYKDLLDDRRQVYPRYQETRDQRNDVKRSHLRHPVDWYLDGHLVQRPAYGIYALATFAEHLLYRVKFGKRHKSRAFPAVLAFYAETRRVMRDVLTACSIDSRLPKDVLERMRARTEDLVKSANEAYQAIEDMKRKCTCPVCHGNQLSKYDVELLEAMLLDYSSKGNIPRDSILFRETPLT